MANAEGINQVKPKMDPTYRTVNQDDLNRVKEMAREITKPQARYHNDQVVYLKGIIAAQIDKASGIFDLINEL